MDFQMAFKLGFYKQHTVPYMHVFSHMRGYICGINSQKILTISEDVCIYNLIGIAKLFSVEVLTSLHSHLQCVSSVPLPVQCVIKFLNLCHLGEKNLNIVSVSIFLINELIHLFLCLKAICPLLCVNCMHVLYFFF